MSARKELIKISKELYGNNIPETVEELFEVTAKYLDTISKQPQSKSSTSKSSTSKSSKKNDSKININIYHNAILVTGYTYDIKDDLKKLKGFWNPENKGWVIRTIDITNINNVLSKKCSNINVVDVDEDLNIEEKKFKSETNLNSQYNFSD